MAAPAAASSSCAMTPRRRSWVAIALIVTVLLASSGLVNGTHFRYGTISWLPRTCDPSSGGRSSLTDPTSSTNCVANQVYVEFSVFLAFRRDYAWGRFFGEEWSNQYDTSGNRIFQALDGTGGFQYFDVPAGQTSDYYMTQFEQEAWAIRFPSGYGSSPRQPIPASNVPGHEVAGSLTAGRLCDNPYDDGLLPQCTGAVSVPVETDKDPRTDFYIPYYPFYEKGLPTGLGADCNCTLAELDADHGTCPRVCTMECTTAPQNSAFRGGSSVCGPWAYSYGFFTGVEQAGGDPDYHKTLEIKLTNIDTNTDSAIGNFIQGEGKIEQQYPSGLAPDGEPWLAFFTGGDRIGKNLVGLQNNYGGRYRLEVSVNLQCHFANPATCWQRSPRATSLPVVPIPYTARNTPSLYDFSFSTFRIAAYDPDIGDTVYYFHANNEKYGSLRDHGIPEGDYPNNPTPVEYNLARQAILDSECGGTCAGCPSNMTLPYITIPGRVEQLTEPFCDAYPEWTFANRGNHTAGPPPRLMIDPYSGVIHWQTGPSPFADDVISSGLGVGGYSQPTSFNPGGIGTPYRWTILDPPQLYDGWVYDRDSYSFKKYSEFSACNEGGGNYNGGWCTTQRLAPGFYNLVLDIRSQSQDPCLGRDALTPVADRCMSLDDILAAESNGNYLGGGGAAQEINMNDPITGPWTPTQGTTTWNTKRGYNTIPLDFLIYLYPAMYMCTTCNQTVAGVETFRDSSGAYGSDVDPTAVGAVYAYPQEGAREDRTFIGTGRCTICGGSDTNSSLLGQTDICMGCLVPFTDNCVKNTRPYWINQDRNIPGDPYTPVPTGWDHTDSRPSGVPGTEPAWGNMQKARITAFKGNIVEFNLVAADDDECVELFIYDTGLFRDEDFSFCNPNIPGTAYNPDACDTYLDTDGNRIIDTYSFSANVSGAGMTNQGIFDMRLGNHEAAHILGYNGTKPPVLGEVGKVVRRKFRWPDLDAWPSVITASYDPRPVDTCVCFFAFDGYLFSDFRCVQIILNTEQQIYWSDRRPALSPNPAWNVVQSNAGFDTGSYTTIINGNNVTLEAPLTMANRTRIVVNVGDLVTFDVQARQSSGYEPLDVFVSQGVLPEGSTFVKDAGPYYNEDPVRYTFTWRPTKGQECEYQLCFLATNTRGTEYPMTVGYSDLEDQQGPKAPADSNYSPLTTSSVTAPYIDERCYTIEVTDTAAHVNAGAFIDVAAPGATSLVSSLDGDCGYSFGGWFYPEVSTAEMALVSIGYTTAGVMTPLHQLRWVYDSTSDDINIGVGTDSTADTGNQYRSLVFYEGSGTGTLNMVAKTAPVACDGGWHYFFVTIDSDKKATIFLDGTEVEMSMPNSHEFSAPPTASGYVTMFPGSASIPAGSSPAFRIGSDDMGITFDGWLNDVRAYSRALTADEVKAQMFATCTNEDASSGSCPDLEDEEESAAAKVGLEMWLNFNDANNANPSGAFDPVNTDAVHGCTSDALPAGASFSRYLSCGTNRDTRDLNEWGGSWEYCNDYTSVVGSGAGYKPDIYAQATHPLLPTCLPHQCYAKAGPACGGTPADCSASNSFTGAADQVCSYQCADIDNSFHGSGYDLSNPVATLHSDDNTIPYVSATNSLGGYEVVGDLREMDTPYAPYAGEMTMFGGVSIADASGKGRVATASIGNANVGTASFEYKASPTLGACPAVPTPNVVHVDGGQEIVLTGKNFAESKFLQCHFSGMGSVPATVVEYDSRGGLQVPSAIKCTAPGGYGAATAAALEVSNNGGGSFTDFNIPVYFTESAAYFDGLNLMELDPTGTAWLADGFSVGFWFNMHDPPAVRRNGLPMTRPIMLLGLEWDSGSTVADHLMLGYSTLAALPGGGVGHAVEVYTSQGIVPLLGYTGSAGNLLESTHGSTGWHYVMLTLSKDGELTLLVDGEEAGKENVTMPGADAKIWVGGRVADNPTQSGTTLGQYAEYWGYIDELSLFSKEVSKCEAGLWMWGNLTKEYDCPSGKHDDGTFKTAYDPLPSGLMAHFSFDGLTYSHGYTSAPLDVYAWDTATLRYTDSSPATAGWVEPVEMGVRINGVLTDGQMVGTSVVYGTTLTLDYNTTLLPGLKFVTVPFLPPSFNAPRRKICGNVRIATSSRTQAAASAATSLSEVGNFMYTEINYVDNTTSGYSGSTFTLGEPRPVPNKCEENHAFLVDSVVPVEGYHLPDPWSPSLTQCSETGVTVYGFGFAKSPWLSCMQGDAEGELSSTAAHYINEAEIRCTAEGTELPYKYKFAVSNNYLPEGSSCDDSPEATVVETPEMLHTKDMSLYFDGAATYAMSSTINSQVSSSAVTFGAWFYPTRSLGSTPAQQEPIVAFGTECGSVLPLFNSAGGAPRVAVVVGATYSEGTVCLTSDLPYYSAHDIPAHPVLDLPTKWDSTFGLLDTSNSSLCLPAAPGQWHYVEIAVSDKELLMDIPSDEPKVSYIATLTVDGETIGGDEDGGDSTLRVPALPVDGGSFFVGGIGCPVLTASASTASSTDWYGEPVGGDFDDRFFQGIIDEVRVYKGVKTDIQWLEKADPEMDLVAYLPFTVTRGDNQRRQTPHCEEFAAGSEPESCIKGGAYFARAVEAHWTDSDNAGQRYQPDSLSEHPRPTGYYPVSRGSPIRPTVYPQLITHTDPQLNVGLHVCDTPTVSDASYYGTSKTDFDLSPLSFDYSTATKQPYAQGGPSRYGHFIPADSTLYNYAAGPDMSFALNAGKIYQGDSELANPDFRYMEVPWYAATIEAIDEDISPLDGGRSVTVTSYNAAPSAWLSCKFRGLKYENQTLSLDDDFASYQSVLSMGDFLPEEADTLRCPFPGTTDPADVAATLGSDWLKVPSMVSLQLVNPKAVESEMVVFKEMALSLGGSVPDTVVTEYASENFHGSLSLTCPDDLRFDTVVFASYGRPTDRCNKQTITHCNGTKEVLPCDWESWDTTKSCDSDSKKPKGFTAGIISSYCHGKKTCDIPTKDEVFGDPCNSKNKWLSVAIECSDRWEAKDYAIMSNAGAATLGSLLNPDAPELGEYTFSAWVKPGEKIGQQAVASFGCKDCAKRNRAVLQWIGVEEKMGRFLYYDDYIQDVLMKREDGSDILLAADQWYQVTFTIDKENCGVLYLNGHKMAEFTTASRPAAMHNPTFTLGMDLDDSLFPKEFFQGMVDEVRIFSKALSEEEVLSIAFWTVDMGSELEEDLVAYYKFNNKAEEDQALAHDETPNALHLTLATSVVDEWDPVTLTYSTMGAVADKHVELEMHGAAWFPATTYELEADFETAPLGGGLASFSIHGVNFVKGSSRVYYGGEDVSDFMLDVDACEISMLVPGADCEGGESSVYVTNTEGCPALSTPETTITQEASVPDIQSGLVCYFPFFGNAMDWSGNGNHADLVDGAELTENRDHMDDQAYSFDGDDVIKVPDCAPLAVSGKTIQTVAMWVKYADIAFPECGKCSEYVGFEEEIGFVGCEMQDHAIMTNAWKLIAAVADDDGTKVYVNGEELVSDSGKLPEYLDLLHNVMLNQEIGGDDFVGLIDDVWIYDRPLCEAELKKLFTTQAYAIEIDGEGAVKAPVLSEARLGTPGLKVTFVTPPATAASTLSEVVVQLPSDNSELVTRAGTGVLDAHPDVTVPSATAADGYSMIVEGSVYAPFSSIYTFSVSASDRVYCWLKEEGGTDLFTITSTQKDTLRTMEREAALTGGEWYALRCAYTKLPDDNSVTTQGSFGIRWRSKDGQINGPLTAPYVRSGGASELVVAAWIHPYEVEGRVGVLSLMGDGDDTDEMARFGLSIVDGFLSAALYTGDEGATCDAMYYREVRSWTTPIEEDKWQHVAVAYDGRVLSFFVDGFMTDQHVFESFAYIDMNSDVELVVGADASADVFEGQVYSVAMYNKVPADLGTWIFDLWECPIGEPEENLILNLLMNEGVGPVTKDLSLNADHPDMRVFGDGVLVPAATWVDATCDTLGTHLPSVEYAGLGLSEGLAGQCMVFSIQSYDTCGRRRLSGGDEFTVEVVGPLHLHTEIHELSVGEGIEDMEDGSYLVHFTREIHGYYLVYVMLDGVVIPNPEGAAATKVYVHSFVTDASKTYMFDEEDMLGLDELQESCAGVPVGFTIQTVDAYENLRTVACDTDAFEVSFDGPYSFDGKVTDMEDGTFAVNYNADVAGPYQMRVSAAVAVQEGVEEKPVYHYGGRTCGAWDKSELDYCTLSDSPNATLAGEDYPICVQVHECGSLRTFKEGIYASFPDTDELDLEGPFTMAAWVRPIPELLTTEAPRQYILSKQSEYSGKGYWLALLPTAVQSQYTLEMGVYVGSENYRVTSQVVPILLNVWTRVGATYDGQKAQLFVSGQMVAEMSWMDEPPLFQRRNAQPLRVGKAFSGHVDNVMLYSAALPEKLMDDSAARCPAVDSDSHESLIAYYRFNEGATRDAPGNLAALSTAWATKDSSSMGNDGFIGLFSDETAQNKEMTIKCPTGYVISEILFANYGSNKGGYGTYEKDECGAENSMSYVEDKCLGLQTCKVLAAYSVFGNPCKHSSKTLAVNAICALPTDDQAAVHWAIGDPAPHWVGTAALSELECPFDDLDSMPMSFQSMLANRTCDDWDMSQATAGETEYFLIRLKDMCGYKNRYPQRTGDYIQIVDTSIMVLDAGDAYEPVYEASSAVLTYPLDFVPPAISMTCGIDQQPEAPSLQGSFLWGGAEGGFDMYCSRYRDLYLGMYTPTAAHEEATFTVNLNVVNSDASQSVTVDIMPADINVAASTTCGPTETAPDCESDMCEDIMAEAGVEAMFEFVAKDEFGNKLRSWDDLADLSLMVEGGQSAIHTVMQGSEEGVYEFYVIFPHEGNFTVTLKAGDDTGCSFTAYVSAAQPHMAVVYNVVPEVRFEHSMVEYDGNLYVFGGASKDKTYLSETWKLNTGYQTFAQGFAYRRKVEVKGLDDLDSVPDSQMVEVLIPSAAWMEGGKLQADCEDLLFLTEDGERMDFWVEPAGAPYGCGAETTKVWVEVTDGADDFHMYYGNKGFKSYSSPSVFAKDGMGMFEDFEFEGSPLDNGWALDGTEHDTCTPLEPGKMGDASSFFTTEDISLTGERSLAVDAYSKIGGSIKKAGGAGLEKSFILKGFFYDTMCSGFHYLSPDFDVCQPVLNSKSMLPDTKNAMGVYTDAKADEYCYTYPWIKSGAGRSVGWHSFTFVGSEDELKLYVDEAWVATTEPTDFSSMFIAGGAFVDEVTQGTKAYWDSLLVTANYAGVVSEVDEEEAVFFDEAHQWSQVGLLDAPPARQAHSAVVFEDGMYVFGGERATYEYSDIWKYSFDDDTWEFIAPRNSSAALGRHDHSAVVYDDVMYVYGGRSPAPKGDFWAYNFEEGTWTEIPSSPGMAPRFGHGATVVGDAMYVYGGYVQDGAGGGLTDEVWSFSFEDMKWTKVGPRMDNFMQGDAKAYIVDPDDAMMFPQMLPDARFSSVLLGRTSTKSFYVLGGAGGDSMMDLLSDVAGFSTEMKQWTMPYTGGNSTDPVARYDAAGALIDDMWACTYGGAHDGDFLKSMVCVFVGDMGLSTS